MPTIQQAAVATKQAKHGQETNALHFSVAKTTDEVMQAWGLVYNAYRRLGLIAPNPWAVHTNNHALTNDTAVIRGRLDGQCVTTITGYLDHPDHGLPLDDAYPDEINRLRDRGCNLIEVGLFADRRESHKRSRAALLDLMRWATYFGLTSGARQVVIGVHPHHAKFYAKCLGFEIIGEEKCYGSVNGAPVVPLLLDWHAIVEGKICKGVRFFKDKPLTASDFAERKQWHCTPDVQRPLDRLLLDELSLHIAA